MGGGADDSAEVVMYSLTEPADVDLTILRNTSDVVGLIKNTASSKKEATGVFYIAAQIVWAEYENPPHIKQTQLSSF